MSRCYLNDPNDDDNDKVLLLVEDFNNDLDVTKHTKMGADVMGNDARCYGIGPNMRDEMGVEIGVEVGDEMEEEMSFKMGIDINIGVDAKFQMKSNDDNDKIDMINSF
ncbi:hypothetical protein NC651_018056 [Populus alba x Populus x berolinensis]|nr:hypothetical protein NC651_018056 [Populus alba x Populus x berolinensis]